MTDPLALRFASTIRATRAGLTDALATRESAQTWLHTHTGRTVTLDEADHAELIRLRQSVRALFAKTVAPHPPSRADANALPPFPEALDTVNRATAPVLRRLRWDETPSELRTPTAVDEMRALRAELADAAVDFFAGPELAQVRVCPAPRCVLYFLKRHPRQEWCSTACGNRARAARHYQAHT
ncbi:ABATE domain-containing protein [Nocardia huaxiensis]|uniref:ABATE domain-containing protein n=1 Tax=Nocardia huaxiensis TaxID=2755382 RepID=A0A7D6ZKI4_9NOCA|nr:ABATE domain-containing protein [Nocardia huaxiensis]QLY31820.1 ABATE domain-containing protein [Nocardia huaxiensis]